MPANDLPFPDNSFKTLYVDPPWPEYGGGKIKRGADKHYSLMKISDIIAMKDEIMRISEENAHLYLWTTNNKLPSALIVMAEWGFVYKTTITWMKERFGLGQYYRGITEHCLFGVRGNLPYRLKEDGKRAQGITGFTEAKREHSRKPERMREMVELVSHEPRVELFARGHNIKGWSTWGYETE